MNGRTPFRLVLALFLALVGVMAFLELLSRSNAGAQNSPTAPAPLPAPSHARSRQPAAVASSAVVTVCRPGGVICDYDSIQAAVNSVAAGTIIKVAAGVYTDTDGDGTVVVIDRMVRLQGGYSTSDWSAPDPDSTPAFIDGEGQNRGVYIAPDVSPVIEGFHIRHGHAISGGGVYIAEGTGAPHLHRNRIYENAATENGGGIYVAGGKPTVENNLIYANTASLGGGIYLAGGFPVVQYNTIYGNQASVDGGGIYFIGTPVIRASIIVQNAASSGGGIYRGGGNYMPEYNDVWNNTGGDYGGFGVTVPPRDIHVDPLFADATRADFHLLTGSPCIDAADPAHYPGLDYDGYARPFGTLPDIGAHEFYVGTCFARVESGAVYSSVQTAVNNSNPGALVRVAGICAGVEQSGVTSQTVRIDRALILRGGYTLTNWEEADWVVNRTVLDAEGKARVIYVAQYIQGGVTIEGFDIRNGYAASSGGGGIYAEDIAYVVIRHNRIYSNTAAAGFPGGGVYLKGGDHILQENELYGNSTSGADGHGGGIAINTDISGGNPTLTDNLIHHNTAGGEGGGLYSRIYRGYTLTVLHNQVYGNTALKGGGVSFGTGYSEFMDNEVYSNTATVLGGGVFFYGGSTVIENNRVYGNRVTAVDYDEGGGGFYIATDIWSTGDQITVRRNLIYANSAADPGGDRARGGGIHAILRYPGTGEIVLEGNRVYSNSSTFRGGGIYVNLDTDKVATISVRNNLVYGNVADDDGGGIACWVRQPAGRVEVEHNTIYGNGATNGGGLHQQDRAPILRNNAIISNTGGGAMAGDGAPDATCDYCDIYGNVGGDSGGGSGAISADPQFVDVGAANFRLRSGSPCIEAAHPVSYTAYDFDGYARPFGARADIGAHEYYTGTCFVRRWVPDQPDVPQRVYTNVQEAVNAIPAGGELRMAGYCRGTLSIGKSLYLHGGYTIANWIVPGEVSTLDAERRGRAVNIATTAPVTLGELVIRGGAASDGAGLYIATPASPTIRNIVFYDNQATGNGGGLASAGGNPRICHATFVGNLAVNGGGIYFAAGQPVVSNSIVVSNVGEGIYAVIGAATPTLDYNNVWNNSGGDYGGSAGPGAHSISQDPRLEEVYRLRIDSPCLHAGQGGAAWQDFEGDTRPLGHAPDLGADERTVYPDLVFAPKYLFGEGFLGQPITYTHYLTNTGNVEDTYSLTLRLIHAGEATWQSSYPGQVSLQPGKGTAIPVAISVPTQAVSGTYATAVLTAVSLLNPSIYDVVSNTTIIERNPGVRITPAYSGHVNPGGTISYSHAIFNTGNAPDTFNLILHSDRGWAQLVAPDQLLIGPRATATLWISVTVPPWMPGGIVETLVLTAFSPESGAWNRVIDTTRVNHTVGDCYVAPGGDDTLNNCHLPKHPCRTISYGVGQATARDTVKVAAGIYYEHDIVINKDITLRGGYDPVSWNFDPFLNQTIVDAERRGRVLYIIGSPTVEGFTLRNGSTAGSGGGVHIAQGSPALRRNTIVYNAASFYGGGIYNQSGSPTLEQNTLAFNTAQRGGGLASRLGAPGVWNNFVYGNNASVSGGGIYVDGGAPRIWHNTLYNNTAARGGGVSVEGGAVQILNTIVARNTATDYGGGIFRGGGLLTLDYNDVWSNTGGDYGGDVSPGPHSISTDPLFRDTWANDLHILEHSPCVNAAGPSTLAFDFDGDPRAIPPLPDIGADEYRRFGLEFAPNRSALGYRSTQVQHLHALTNTGNNAEDFYFSCTGLWTMCPPSTTVEAGQTVTVVVGVNIPGNAISGDVDVAVVTAILTTTPGAEVYPAIRRQVVDTTTVGLSCGVKLESSPPRLIYDPSITTRAVHWIRVENTGSWTNTFALSYTDMRGFTVMLEPAEVTLGPDYAQTVRVTVEWSPIPQDCVSDPLIDYTSVTAVSRFPECVPPVSKEVVLETWLSACPLSIIAPQVEACGCSWDTLHLTHTLENKGNYGRAIMLNSIPEQWPHYYAYPSPAEILLLRDEWAFFTNNVAIPNDRLCGASDRIHVIDFGSIPVARVIDTVTVAKCPVILLEPDRSARVRSHATQSTTVTYNHVLTNSGNCTFTIDLEGSSSNGWPIEIVPSTVISIPPGGSVPVSVRVTVPPIEPECANAVVDSTVVTATPRGTDIFFTIGAGGRYGVEDSRSPTGPRFAWMEISETGTDLGLNGNDVFGSLPIGFDFPFYGHTYNTVFASSNGLLTFGAGNGEPVNAHIPWPAPPNDFIAPFWDDQRVSRPDNERVYYQTFGSAPNRYLVVQWRTRPVTSTYPSPLLPPYEYEAILYEDGTIVFQYNRMSDWIMGDGRSATVGIENESGAVGTQYSVNREAIADGLAVRFTPLDSSVEDITYVNICEVDLEPSQEAKALPGDTIHFQHVLTNTGVITDSYTLSFLDSRGWRVEIEPTQVGPLPPGGSAHATVRLTLPLTPTEVLSGTVDILLVTASSRSISFSDTVTDTTTVGYLPAGKPRAGGMEAAFGPTCYSLARPGGMVTCTHTLTNTGNYTETFDLTTHSTFAYAQIVSPISGVVGPLRPGASYGPVVVNILLPPQAAPGEVEQSEVLGVLRGQSDWQVVVVDLTTAEALTGTRHVAPNGLDENNNCLVPLEYGPCRTPQHAVDKAWEGDLVKVAGGVYYIPAPSPGANRPYTQVVYLDKEIRLQGGYSPVEWSALPDPLINQTILDASWRGRVVYIASGISPTIEGFHIRGGVADNGAGLYIAAGSSPVIRDNLIYENRAVGPENRGGGIYSAGSPVLDGDTFRNNTAMDGAGIYIGGGKPTVWNNLIYRNAAVDEGGGLYLADGEATVWNSTFYSNTAVFGGGIEILGGRLSISNTVFSHNANHALYKAGGVVASDYNDWWANMPDHIFGSGVFTGAHSILSDPLFVSSGGENFRLREGSPCIDTGDPATTLRTDRDGNRRPLFDGYDIGAYEYGLSSVKLVYPDTVPPGGIVTYTVVITRVGNGGQTASITDTLPSLLDCEEGRLEGVGWSSGSGQYLRNPCRVSWSGVTGPGRVSYVNFTARVIERLGAGTLITNVAWVNAQPSQAVTFVVGSRAGTRYVTTTGDDTPQGVPNNCLFPTYPCRTIQHAVGQAMDGDAVRVATGVYTGSGAVISLTHKSLNITGGYSPTLPTWVYDPARFPTTLDARGGIGVLLTGPATVTLAGIRITNGAVGITATLSSVAITRCHVYGHSGDGVHIISGALTLERTWVHRNDGDGVVVEAGDYRLDNNILADNAGAGLRTGGTGTGRLRHNTLASNIVGAYISSVAHFTNTIIASHTVGIDASVGAATLTATLWSGNATESTGSVVRVQDVSGASGFADAGGGDYHISGGSAALNRGIAAGLYEDIDGEPRPQGGKYDIGADESPLSIEAAKQARPDPVMRGAVLSYTIRITNTGRTDLHATIVDRLPDCLSTTSALQWNATIPAGSVWTYMFTATVGLECEGTLTNVVEVATAEGITGIGTATSHVLCPRPLEGVRIVGPTTGAPGIPYSFTAVITPADATEPVLYDWSPQPEAGQGTPVVTYTWSTTATQRITVSVRNCGGAVQAHHTIVITNVCPVPLTGAGIVGPVKGYINTPYTFTAVLTPAEATSPIYYTWGPTGTIIGPWTERSAVYRWNVPGVYTATLTVENCGGMFIERHTVTITSHTLYLPVVLRSYSGRR